MRNWLRQWLGIETLAHSFRVDRVSMRKQLNVFNNLVLEVQLIGNPEIDSLKERVKSLEEIVLSYQKEAATKVAEPKRRQVRSWTEFRAKIEAEPVLSNDAT